MKKREPHTHSLADLKRDAEAVIERLQRSRKPQLITVRGRTAAVMIDDATWNEVQHKLDLLDSLEGLNESLKDIEAGRHRPLDDSIAEIRRRSGLTRLRKSA